MATLRALKLHGGVKLADVAAENIGALEKGFDNLRKHMDNIRLFGVPLVVALNRFPDDPDREIRRFLDLCAAESARAALSDVYGHGGAGGVDLAHSLMEAIENDPRQFQFLYPLELPLVEKIETVARKVYGAAGIAMEGKTRRKLKQVEADGFGGLPVCIAKTQYSLSDDSQALGRPTGFELIVTDVSVSAGAGFVVVYCGDIMTMPGLPASPAAEHVDVTDTGELIGLS